MFLFKDNLSVDEATLYYYETIKNDLRFNNDIDESRLNIIDLYFDYYDYEFKVTNHPFYLEKKDKSYSYNGFIDITYNYSDKDLILNELDKKNASSIDLFDNRLYDESKEEISFNKALDKLENKAILNVLDTTKYNYKDVNLEIGLFKDVNVRVNSYYEHIVVFHYKSLESKHDFISILSLYNKKFYKLEFETTIEYKEFYKIYKRPTVYIPSNLLDLYYINSFKSYLNMKRILIYENNSKVLKKIKEGLKYRDFTPYKDYLDYSVYYYKNSKFLNMYPISYLSIKERIYLSFLTLNYNKDSGIFLANCIDLDLLENNSLYLKLKYLKISYHLKSMEAKALLFKHYSSYLYYDEVKLKRYT